jgi:hypothetical protein
VTLEGQPVVNRTERLRAQTGAAMIVIAAVALYGAALGLSMRPALRAVVLAAASVAVAQYAAIWLSGYALHRPDMDSFGVLLQAYAGSDAKDLIPTVSSAAFAATLTATISAIFQSGERRRRVRRVSVLDD